MPRPRSRPPAPCYADRDVQITSTRVELLTRGADGGGVADGPLELPAEFLARYLPEELLGYGATGTVYRARSLASGARVAVKFLTRVDDPATLARFLREGQLMMEIADPGVVRV